MSQCSRCKKPCSATTLYCHECQSQQQKQDATYTDVSMVSTTPLAALPSKREEARPSSILERFTRPYAPVPNPNTPPPSVHQNFLLANPQTPPPAVPHDFIAPDQQLPPTGTNEDYVEKALHKLRDAARRIAAVEQRERGNRQPLSLPDRHSQRAPRASRLSPLRDISADIQRHSTPMPRTFSDGPVKTGEEALGGNLPDLWPWLQDPDADETEQDNWAGRTDPLQARHIPDSHESALIEAEDVQRAIAAGLITPSQQIKLTRKRQNAARLRTIFACVALLAVLALTIDSILVSFAFLHRSPNTMPVTIAPVILLSSNTAKYGQTVTLYLKAFQPLTSVYLTHDVEEPLLPNTNHSIISINQDGTAQASIYIDSSVWNPGFHKIEAEDIKSRYTASTTLQVAEGPTRPSHLILNLTDIDLGAGVVGANTIQPLTLHNSGNSGITWAASSNQPWLQITPNQGSFSDSQTVTIAGQRANLQPGDYKGTLTFSSNVGANQLVQVTMTVRPLPPDAGAALSIAPAVLSFMAVDNGSNPTPQTLVISNPGTKPLYWSVKNNTPANGNQNSSPNFAGNNVQWATTSLTSGVVAPQGSSTITITANSANLLPGTYTNMLVFATTNGHTAYNSPQNVTLSLTVQPRCSLVLSTASMMFTAVSGQTNPSSQTLTLSDNASCPGVINWHATSAAPWLLVTPASGQLKGATSSATTLNVNVGTMKAGIYPTNLTIQTAQNSQSVMVQLTVQPPLSPKAPTISASPLNVNFSTIQGQASPPGQVVTIANTGGSPLIWRTTVNLLAVGWLGVSPTGGTIAAGQTGTVTINVNPGRLNPGTYVGQVILNATDTNNVVAGGSPQTIMVNLTVSASCTLTPPSASSLAFNATVGGSDPAAQTVIITASGSCGWPLNWQASTSGSASWLKVSPSSNSFAAAGQSATLNIAPTIAGLSSGTYSAQVSISATDSTGMQAQGSPQAFTVTLTLQQSCSLSVSPGNLSFSLTKGQSTQTLNVSQAGTCPSTINLKATTDAGSSAWLNVSSSSNAVTVTASMGNLTPNTYTGTLNLSAQDSNGAPITINPQTIPVTLTVVSTHIHISGTVNECADTSCSTSSPFVGAMMTLTDSSGQTIATTTTDSSGNYSFTNVPQGSYTVTATGNASGTNYTGHTSISGNGDQSGVNINAIPS